jgi:hypothetical protein
LDLKTCSHYLINIISFRCHFLSVSGFQKTVLLKNNKKKLVNTCFIIIILLNIYKLLKTELLYFFWLLDQHRRLIILKFPVTSCTRSELTIYLVNEIASMAICQFKLPNSIFSWIGRNFPLSSYVISSSLDFYSNTCLITYSSLSINMFNFIRNWISTFSYSVMFIIQFLICSKCKENKSLFSSKFPLMKRKWRWNEKKHSTTN